MSQNLDLAGPIRVALLGNPEIAPLLAVYAGEGAVFTRRPVPTDAPYPMAVVSPDVSISDVDFLTARLPVVRRDIVFFGLQPDQYRVVEELGYLARQQFHRVRSSLAIPGYSVVDIVVTGPRAAPVDGPNEVARACLLTIKLRDLAT